MELSSIWFARNCKFIQCHTRNRPFCFCIKSPGSKIYFMDAISRGICNRCIQYFMGKYKILCFTSIQSDRSQQIENQARCIWCHDYPLLEHAVLVPNDILTSPRFPCNSSTKHPSITVQSRSATSTLFKKETAGSSFISKSLRHPNIPPEITDVMLCMYRNGCLYSGLCASRSALSSSITTKGHLKLSDHLLISRYLNGIYNRHPPLPKYVNI